MNDLITTREEELALRFSNMFPNLSKGDFSLPDSYSDVVSDAVESFLQSSDKELEALALSRVDEVFQKQSVTTLFKDLSEQDIQKLYLEYIDFIVDIRRRLIHQDNDYRHMFMLKPSYSPSVEAYEEVGYNKLEISPRLSSCALVS